MYLSRMISAHFLACGMLCVAAVTQVGCVTYTHHAVPANRLPAALHGPSRNATVPINLVHLRQEPPSEFLVGPGDVLGIYVQGVIPPQVENLTAMQTSQILTNNNYYPPTGFVRTPTVGVPLNVSTQGELQLPLVGALKLTGLTLDQTAEAIREAYFKKNVIQMGRDRIIVSLIRPRVHRILVIREDSGSDIAQMMRKDAVVFAKRGRGELLDLPAFENDILHALTATGGLPGLDTVNQVRVLRSKSSTRVGLDSMKNEVEASEDLDKTVAQLRMEATEIVIPLRLHPGEPLPFGAEDILLHDGDIVYVEPRIADVFYVGGLLPGGQIPLPRDHDIDVIEAIALAQGSIGGPGGVSGASVFRTGAGPGNIIPPTRVLILRKLPNGQQLSIRADLSRAMRDQKERIIIQPGDFVTLHYKPGEITANVALNFFNFNVLLSPFE